MTNTFKALSALLSYPTAELKEAAGDIRNVFEDEQLVAPKTMQQLHRFIDDLTTSDLFELQERYVFLFDRTRSLSLHLFEHVHGESRGRGQAMVDLKALYAEAGLEIDARELPDFLPLFLEYLSVQPLAEARALLAEPVTVIVALKERLLKRQSDYACLFGVLEEIANSAPENANLEELRRAPDDDPNDLDALDKAWEDEPVTFGPGDSGCSKVDQIRQMASADAATRLANGVRGQG